MHNLTEDGLTNDWATIAPLLCCKNASMRRESISRRCKQRIHISPLSNPSVKCIIAHRSHTHLVSTSSVTTSAIHRSHLCDHLICIALVRHCSTSASNALE